MRTISGSRPRASAISRSVAGVAVAVMPRIAGGPSSAAQRVERAADEEVVGAEVVPPHADAVHLVDHDETDVDLRDRVEEAPRAEPLGRDVEHPVTAFGHAAQPRRGLVGIERGVDQRRLGRDLGRQLVDLVLHQRDQRAQHERRSRPQHRGQLVGEGLARAGRHQREGVASLDGSADDGLLAGAESSNPNMRVSATRSSLMRTSVRSGSERIAHGFATALCQSMSVRTCPAIACPNTRCSGSSRWIPSTSLDEIKEPASTNAHERASAIAA